MKKFLPILAGVLMLYQIHAADLYGKSRKELGIPEPTEQQLVGEHLFGHMIISEYDTDGDGEVDMKEMYLTVPTLPMVRIRMKTPSAIWYDKNNNGIPDPGELFISPKADEDWKPYFGRNDAEI